MKLREVALIDQVEGAAEHVLGLGRKSRNDIRTENDIGPQPAHLFAERNRVRARVPALHPLENEIVAGLQRQVQMRHQARLVGDRIEEIGIGFY